jgi:hypothetical protein
MSKFFWSWIGAVVCLVGLGCGGAGLGPTEFIVRVDSISAPDAIAATDTLIVRFWGRLGPDGCSRLDEFDTGRAPGVFEITFHGERLERGQCTDMPVALIHDETILPPMQDPFTIRVRQPDGTTLNKSVRIR